VNNKKLRQIVTFLALLLALGHIIWPNLAIDFITIVLLIAAIMPWLAPLFKSFQFPGGWKIEFQDLQKTSDRADAVGLLSSVTNDPEKVSDHSFLLVKEQDPNLALAGLRIALERRLNSLAFSFGHEIRSRGIGNILREVLKKDLINKEEYSILTDMVALMNQAVHGAQVDKRAAEWAINIGPKLLKNLEERAEGPWK
jgi:hypothetical protein